MTQFFSHREVDGLWYTWSDDEDRPVSCGKKLEVSAKDRATQMNGGGCRIPVSVKPWFVHLYSTDEMVADFDKWADAHGHTDPLIARLRIAA